MTTQDSLSILLDPSGKDQLSHLTGKVLENIQKGALSFQLKNQELSGTPEAGAVEVKRLANASAKDYGTARTGGKGEKIKVKPVTVAIDQNREIVEELEQKDLSLSGLDGLLARRSANHEQQMISELDNAFFKVAAADGTLLTLPAAEAPEMAEAAIQQCETTKNDYVDGVPRSMMNLVCSPSFYGKLRSYLDKVTLPGVDAAQEEFTAYHGVKAYSTVHLPAGTDFMLMVNGAVAQPVLPRPYSAEKIPMSEAYALELFFYYGTKTIMPDLIFVQKPASQEG